MKASVALCLCGALIVSVFLALPAPQPSAQKYLSTGESKADESPKPSIEWGEEMPLEAGQKVSIKADLKAGTFLTYAVATRGLASATDGDIGAVSEVINNVRLNLSVIDAYTDKPSPDAERAKELTVEYQMFSTDVRNNNLRWAIMAKKAFGGEAEVAKLYLDGKETAHNNAFGLPSPSALKTNLNNKVAFARLGAGNALSQISHGVKWGTMPRDVPQAIIDPIALTRFIVLALGDQELEVAMDGDKPSATFSVRGVELPVEVAKGRSALFDLTFTLQSARGGAKKGEVVHDVTVDGEVSEKAADAESADKEMRLLTFGFEAVPQPGQKVEVNTDGTKVVLTPGAYAGTVAIDPRSGVLGFMDITGSNKGEGEKASTSLHVTISLVDKTDS